LACGRRGTVALRNVPQGHIETHRVGWQAVRRGAVGHRSWVALPLTGVTPLGGARGAVEASIGTGSVRIGRWGCIGYIEGVRLLRQFQSSDFLPIYRNCWFGQSSGTIQLFVCTGFSWLRPFWPKIFSTHLARLMLGCLIIGAFVKCREGGPAEYLRPRFRKAPYDGIQWLPDPKCNGVRVRRLRKCWRTGQFQATSGGAAFSSAIAAVAVGSGLGCKFHEECSPTSGDWSARG